jgi:adenine/guanine phosphoribosyltransferase-like PRPP-binding protein
MDLRKRLASLDIKRWSLSDLDWVALHEPAGDHVDWGLTFPSQPYVQMFDRSFPDLVKNEWRVTAKSCLTFFRGISEEDLVSVRRFVEAIKSCVVIKDLTIASLALGFHARKGAGSALEPTELGQLMRDAKPYDRPPTQEHRDAARELARRMCEFVSSVPFYRDVDGFIAIPSSKPDKVFSLPVGFARKLAKHTGKLDLSDAVAKAKATRELKNLSREQKVVELIGSVTVDKTKVLGKSIVLVDDLYQSGLTINFIAEELRQAGAKEVFGLAAVKTMRNDDNRPKIASSAQVDDDLDSEDLF